MHCTKNKTKNLIIFLQITYKFFILGFKIQSILEEITGVCRNLFFFFNNRKAFSIVK